MPQVLPDQPKSPGLSNLQDSDGVLRMMTEQAERRQRVAESMRDIIRMINQNLPLKDILDNIITLAVEHQNASAGYIYRWDRENEQLVYDAYVSMPEELGDLQPRTFEELNLESENSFWHHALQGELGYGNYGPLPERIDIVLDNPDLTDEFKAQSIAIRKCFSGSLGVPLSINNKIYGGLVFYYSDPQDFSEEQLRLAQTYSEQVALAIENANLRIQAENAAVLTERNRLARDLHDAVTQTLFSTSLIADVLPRIWERNPEEGRRRLEELRQLTRGALSEMRTLLLELRPGTLDDTPLKDLVEHQVNAFIARSRIQVEFEQRGDYDPPPDVKEAFYRISQETLNNILKHANATAAYILLAQESDEIILFVMDNGRGFNPEMVTGEHLGLGIMRERARSIGGELSIDSLINQGTQTRLIWKPSEEE